MTSFDRAMLVLIIIVVLCLTTGVVIDRVLQHREIELLLQKERDCMELWQPPTIPDCDAPTWERIINGCDEGED